jgi:hypothetical protein
VAVDFGEARNLIGTYEEQYRTRHEAFKALRKYWHGDFWSMADTEQGHSITSVFRDLTAHLSDIGPDIKLVHNVVQQVCVKYQTFLSPLPQIRVWVDPPETDTRRAQASKKQRFLYGSWSMGNMDRVFNRIGWYLPLMGDCYLGIHPDFDKHLPTPLLRSPEYAFPIPGFDGNSEQAVCFKWKIPESVAARNFPEYSAPIETMRTERRGLLRRGGSPVADPMVEIIEYSDKNEWHRWLCQVTMTKRGASYGTPMEVNGVEHGFGFNLFEHLKFIDVPDEVWGHGAVEQAINLNEMGNALYSLLFQSVIENVFPRLVLIDPAKAPEEIETGPGAIIPINQGGGVEWLHPPTEALNVQQNFANMNDHNIKESTGMPEVQFGQSPATSIVTGKAVNELQGAGTGSMVEMVQGVGIGNGVVNWNEKAISIAQRLFREDQMYLFGAEYSSSLDLVPQRFALTVKGKELVGSPRNEVIFAPAINPHEKLVMWLQAKGGGLVSDKFIREQIGINDNDAMVEEIFAEAADQAVLGAYMQAVQASGDPASVETAETQAASLLAGSTARSAPGQPGPPHPLLNAPGGPPGGSLRRGGPRPDATAQYATGGPPGPMPPGNPQGPPSVGGTGTPTGVSQPQGGSAQTLTLNDVVAAFRQLQGVAGQVFLVGELVQHGETDSDIEVMLTEKADQQVIAQQLPQWSGRLSFHVVSGAPGEPHIDVTPQ